MEKPDSHIVVDAGNTRIKVALFNSNNFEEFFFIPLNETEIKEQLKKFKSLKGLISSVIDANLTTLIQKSLPKALVLNSKSIIFENTYKTFETLGADRKANVMRMLEVKYKPALTVDIGTCIKFDFIDDYGIYKGGSISPGLNMRLKALNHFTGKLPLVQFKPYGQLIGESTEESILSGVLVGLSEEINALISRYEKEFKSLTVFVTGGDAKYIAIQKKKAIFADDLHTIRGLNYIYLNNDKILLDTDSAC